MPHHSPRATYFGKYPRAGRRFSFGSWLGRLREQIGPNRIERIKANKLLLKARNCRLDGEEIFKEAYRAYLKGDSKEALRLFVSAAEIESQATRLKKEEGEIFVGIGKRIDPTDYFCTNGRVHDGASRPGSKNWVRFRSPSRVTLQVVRTC